VAQVSGLVIAESIAGGADVAEYSPNQIKAAVAGDGRADKQQMQDMVKVLLKLSSTPKPPDAADAAAIALCHLAHDPRGFMKNRVSARIGR
jgi:crossover junction endodeoxyribonuclease RuvC